MDSLNLKYFESVLPCYIYFDENIYRNEINCQKFYAMAAQLSLIIASVLTKPDIVQRKVSALVGAVVADAASQHLQWIYDQVKCR